MNGSEKILNQILTKYKISNNIPVRIQNYAISSGKKNLKFILKKTGNYSIIFSMIMFFYYLLKQFGIKATFLQAKIILTITSISITATTISGGYITAKHYYPEIFKKKTEIIKPEKEDIKLPEDKNKAIKKSTELIIKKDKKLPKINTSNVHKYIIGVQNFTGDDKITTQLVTKKINTYLQNKYGQKKITLLKNVNRNRVSKIVMGSIRKLGESQYISVKIVDVANSKIDMAFSEKINKENEINQTCQKIVKKIIEKYQ